MATLICFHLSLLTINTWWTRHTDKVVSHFYFHWKCYLTRQLDRFSVLWLVHLYTHGRLTKPWSKKSNVTFWLELRATYLYIHSYVKFTDFFHLSRNYSKTAFFGKIIVTYTCVVLHKISFLTNCLSPQGVELGGSKDCFFKNFKMYENGKVDSL